MEFKVDINAENINKTITEAIAKSAIGVELDKVIKKQVAELSKSYNNPLAAVVGQEIHKIMQQVITENYSNQIKIWVTERMTEEFTNDIFNKLWKSFNDRY